MSPNQSRRALVLSGGSIKGSFQVGAIFEVLRRGFVPDAIYGISVGSLNGAFLANLAGEDARNQQSPDWPQMGQKLWNFWAQNITGPERIAKKRSGLSLLFSILFKNFKGLVDTKPIHELVHQTLKIENLLQCPVTFKVGVVNMASGKHIIADKQHPRIIDYVLASTAIPVVMPVSEVDGSPLTDGGVRDVALFGQAIDDGATDIVSILCQPEEVGAISINCGDFMKFASRLMDIVTNETVNNDIRMFSTVNQMTPEDGIPLADGPMRGMRHVKSTIIRPTAELDIDLDKFTAEDILRNMQLGQQIAASAMA